MKLFNFQKQILNDTKDFNKVAYYAEMGTGKTFIGGEKLCQLNSVINIVICQKSKINDWVSHFRTYYNYDLFDLTNKKDYIKFHDTYIENRICFKTQNKCIAFINYELCFRRKDLLKLEGFTMLLDESSMMQNDSAKRTKFILKMKAENVILLSGTPTSGKYENLFSQIKLLGWDITKNIYWNHYVDYVLQEFNGIKFRKVIGYKNIDRLKQKLKEHGAVFLTTEQAGIDLPESNNINININCIPEYYKFIKNGIVSIGDTELVGDTSLTKLLYSRMLCGHYNKMKLQSFRDLLNSTNDRIIVFYNFNSELYAMEDVCIELDKLTSIVNGECKDLKCYEEFENSVTFIQYQAGAMGLNLQKANKTIYFSLPLSSELFEQSKARTRRIGQNKTCFYYYLICEKSVENKILETLQMRKDYNDRLFEQDFGGVK